MPVIFAKKCKNNRHYVLKSYYLCIIIMADTMNFHLLVSRIELRCLFAILDFVFLNWAKVCIIDSFLAIRSDCIQQFFKHLYRKSHVGVFYSDFHPNMAKLRATPEGEGHGSIGMPWEHCPVKCEF